MSIRVTPASSAAWMVRMDRSSPGRPSIDIGIPPRPMALTVTGPMVLVRICPPVLSEPPVTNAHGVPGMPGR